MLQLQKAQQEHRTLLWNIHQKFLYEMTNYYDNPMEPDGNYHFCCFDACFSNPACPAFLIYMDETLVGFAMLSDRSYLGGRTDHVLAEFTIFPAFRRQPLQSLSILRCVNSPLMRLY